MKVHKHPDNNALNKAYTPLTCEYVIIDNRLVLENICIETDSILLDQIQRKFLKVVFDQEINVQIYDIGRATPLKQANFQISSFGNKELPIIENLQVPCVPIVNNQEIIVKYSGLRLKLKYIGQPGLITKSTEILSDQIIKPHKTNILGMDLEEEGIGGLGPQFERVFKEAFVSRAYPPEVIKEMGIQHLKGMILYGPPGCGKSLLARQLSKLLQKGSKKESKIVNGPELLDSYVGSSEKNVRSLFSEAEEDQKKYGDKSPLHVIIFDEFDAIARKRGNGNDAGSRVSDGIVNQLLTKIDGVNQLNNILVIGMTNRLDIIDPALLRSGRFGLHLEIGIPDLEGRKQIFRIHTKSLRESNRMENVDLDKLAELADNYTGADIAALVQKASSSALKRGVDLSGDEPKIDKSIKVTSDDFMRFFKN